MNDEIEMIRDAVARFLETSGGLDPARKAHDGSYDAGLWTALQDNLQLAGLTLPEAAGGLDMGLSALVPVAAELGRVLAPLPFVSTLGVAAAVLSGAEDAAGLLDAISEGRTRVALANWDAKTVTATTGADGWRLNGDCGLIPDGGAVDKLLVLARDEDGVAVFVLPAAAAQPVESFDPTQPAARLALSGTPAKARIAISVTALEQALAEARVALAAEAAGAARGVFDLTRAYIDERKQFGRSIASFQAIKHRIAALFVKLNALDALVAGAAEALDAGDPIGRGEALTAWATARELQSEIAAEAIQLHGGVGATWEYPPHMFFKRARAQAQLAGRSGTAFASVGTDLLEGRLSAVPEVADTPFRREVRDWLGSHLTGRFEAIIDRGHAGDGDTEVALRKEWEREMARGGWVGMGLPVSVGGRGLSVADQVAFHEEYARVGGPGHMGHIGEGLVAPTLLAHGSEDQKARFLPGILKGETFWAQGYSEPGAGSDLAAVRTRARRCPETGDWLVSGQKTWTSLAHVSDWIFVLARAEEGSVGRKGLIFLLMPLDQPGIECRQIRQINGGAEFNEVFFDEARAKACDAIGDVGDGWTVAMSLLGFERGISTLGQQMTFARELDHVIEVAREGGDGPALAERLGRAWSELRAMRHGALRMLQAQADNSAGAEILGYKLEWSEWHRALGDLAMDALGAQALGWSEDPMRQRLQHLYLFSRADTIYGGTSEIQLNIIAEQGLGMPREPRGGK
ncbi:acyl-CoA dehydrogenase [Oceanicola sp. S124]|uniref:acyl-CoA dehydrogenase n=1 Tax=Oceanicola sp. S124 TaxID=1042378 RepID=UPI00192AB388|nr:acyl-CoA dehydrogenase [Oceanicola sp. S124]